LSFFKRVSMLVRFAARARACRRVTLAVAIALISAGCGGRHAPDTASAPDRDAPVALTISNNNWLDATIYVEHDGEVSRIGTVTAASHAAFYLASWMLGSSRTVRLVAHPIGSAQAIGTELLHIEPGQFIEWRLENELAMSSVGVY
jgi:hypothetical protein